MADRPIQPDKQLEATPRPMPGPVEVPVSVFCAGCGEGVEAADRFCAFCGLPNTVGNRGVDQPDAGPRRPPGLMAAASVLIAGVVAVAVYLLVVDGSAEVNAELDAVAEADTTEPTSDLREQPEGEPTAADNSVAEPVDDGEAPIEDGVAAESEAGESEGEFEVPPPVDITRIKPSDVATMVELSGLRGYYLFVGNGQVLIRLDTDTGAIEQYQEIDGIVGYYRDRLISIDPTNGITTRSVEDPLQAPHHLMSLGEVEGASTNGGRIEIFDAAIVSNRWLYFNYFSYDQRRIAYDDSVLIDLLDKKVNRVEQRWWGIRGDVAWVPGGGTFQRIDDQFEFMARGQPGMVGSESIFMETCTGLDVCKRWWVDRATGEAVDRPALPDQRFNGMMIDGSDRVAVFHQNDSGRQVYYDTVEGKLLPGNIRRSGNSPNSGHSDAVTTDDRFLVTSGHSSDGTLIYDLENDRAFAFDLEIRAPSSVVLVPKPEPEPANAS